MQIDASSLVTIYNPLRSLDREWASISDTPTSRRTARAWAAADEALSSFRSPAEVVSSGCRKGAEHAHRVVAALVRLSPTDPMAARTALQALVPGMANIVRRTFTGPGRAWMDSDELAGDVVAATWERIVNYEGPDEFIAERILSQTRRRIRTIAEGHDRRACREAPITDGLDLATSTPSAADRILAALSEGLTLGAITRAEAGFLFQATVGGIGPIELAKEHCYSLSGVHMLRRSLARKLHYALAS